MEAEEKRCVMNLKSLSFITLPALFLVVFVVGLGTLSRLEGLSVIFISAIALFIMQLVYLVDLFSNDRVRDKFLWALGLFLLFIVVHPFYWRQYVHSSH